jgi:hypothetical protein
MSEVRRKANDEIKAVGYKKKETISSNVLNPMRTIITANAKIPNHYLVMLLAYLNLEYSHQKTREGGALTRKEKSQHIVFCSSDFKFFFSY